MLKRFIIERNADGIGYLPTGEYSKMAKHSNEVLDRMGPGIQWEESYVTGDKIFCVYLAEDEQLIWDHAKLGEIPINNVYEVKRSIDPTTATLSEQPYITKDEDIYDSIL